MRTVLVWLCLLCVCLCPLGAEEDAPSYLVVAAEDMEDALVERVRGWMEKNLHYPVRVARLPGWEGETGEAQAEAVLERVETPGLVTVVMSDRLKGGAHAVTVPERRVGVMNVALLVPEVNETTLRRLDRQAIRIVGFSLGVPPQPVPFCALYPYQNLEELDRIGRGFSPPAMARYRRALEEREIPLSPDARRYLPKLQPTTPSKD